MIREAAQRVKKRAETEAAECEALAKAFHDPERGFYGVGRDLDLMREGHLDTARDAQSILDALDEARWFEVLEAHHRHRLVPDAPLGGDDA